MLFSVYQSERTDDKKFPGSMRVQNAYLFRILHKILVKLGSKIIPFGAAHIYINDHH